MQTQDSSRAPAVLAVERLLRQASERSVSDLHLDPTEAGLRVRLRKDGALVDDDLLPAALAPNIVGRLKALADLLAYRSDVPQEGRIAACRSGIGSEVRVATYPTLFGERVALRFDDGGQLRSFDGLGLAEDVHASLNAAIERPDGVVLLTGPAGSGKTTSLYACVERIAAAAPPRSIMTIEDPIERRVAGATQSEINTGAGFGFAQALRSLLRQDPEVLLVGEIRDRETAAIVFEAGLTGHLVLSTLHAGTGRQVIARLREFGIEPFVLATVLRGVLAQRLLRKCAAPGRSAGRLLVSEWLPVTPELLRGVLARATPTLRDDAARLVAAGLTTETEVARVLGRD